MGAAAQLERGLINKRLRNGRKNKATQGGYAYGSPRYGKKSVNKELVDDDIEDKGKGCARELRAEGLSYREICDTLAEEGVRTKKGGKWHPSTVQRMLDGDARARHIEQDTRTRDFRKKEAARAKAGRVLGKVAASTG
ncbi:recombinase family protein [Streptomyces blastmyceticus]|uniref:Resolvase/invertase-type recombinase catalytic domain-containing protein n=1 Tax=Streptomyces blastmyceticus TaxID=68180 RepID=A0ABN0Y1F6_9ACTN